VCEEEGDGREIGDGKTEKGADEDERGVVELRERGAGDHVADFGEGGVGAEAAAFAGDAHPYVGVLSFGTRPFDGAGERAVVDDFAADGGEAADAFKRVAAQEDAAAGGSGDARFWVGDFFRRIEHEEEEEKRRDEEALGQSFCAEKDHEGVEGEVVLLGAADQARKSVGGVDDVGVGEPEVGGRGNRRG
jgi:hypothetical protein